MEIREISCRGKAKATGEWVPGHLLETCFARYIITGSSQNFHSGQFSVTTQEIIPESLGLFTGYYDLEGYYVYEGDVLAHPVDPLTNLVILWDTKTAGIVVYPFKNGVVNKAITYKLNELIGSVETEDDETRVKLAVKVIGQYMDMVEEQA